MTTRSISEDAPELTLPARGPERLVDVSLRHHEVERAVERLRLRPRAERPARAIQLPLVKLHVLVPQHNRHHLFLPRSLPMYIIHRSMNIGVRQGGLSSGERQRRAALTKAGNA